MANKKFECEICKIYTTDQSSYDSHLLGSKHQLNLHMKLVKEKKEKCGVYITGIPAAAQKEEVMNYFSKFGKIVDYHCGLNNSFVIIQFLDELSAREVLNKYIKFQGRSLKIQPRVVRNQMETKAPVKQEPQISFILDQISRQPTFELQLSNLILNLQVHENYFEPPKYNRVCGDIESCLRTKFPHCKVWPFGSTVSGLGFKNSDLDIFVEMVQPLDISSSSESPATVSVRIARNILNKNRIFSHVIAIPKAKTPIVKLVHKPTGINCDINFKNMLGVCNSNLIKFLLLLDNRLRPFMFIIKFWALIHEISGSGKISNYGIVMMAIFFLQQLPDPILPPIGLFQTPDTITFIEGWNGGFLRNSCLYPAKCKNNRMSIVELLYEFFNFWAKFDYSFNVICPLAGKIMLKSDFSNPENLPPNFYLYKENLQRCGPLKTDTAICLQDPFELCHSVTQYVSPRLLEDFQKLCDFSAELCNNCIVNNKTENILPKLFVKQHFEKILIISDEKCVFKMSGATINSLNIKDKKDDPNYCRKIWFDTINQFLLSVLSKLFLFKVCVSKDVQLSKSQRLDGQSDIHDKTTIDSLTFHCIGNSNVWEARKSIAKNVGQIQVEHKGFLEQEIAISEYIVNVLCKGIRLATPIVDFSLTVNCKTNPTEAEFVLHNLKSRKNSFKVMANFIAKKLPSWCERYIRESQNKKPDVKTEVDKKEIKEDVIVIDDSDDTKTEINETDIEQKVIIINDD